MKVFVIILFITGIIAFIMGIIAAFAFIPQRKKNVNSTDSIKTKKLEFAIKQGDYQKYLELCSRHGIFAEEVDQDLGKTEHYSYLVINQSGEPYVRAYAMLQLGMIFGNSYYHNCIPNSYERIDISLYWLYQAKLNGITNAGKYIEIILYNAELHIPENILSKWRKDYNKDQYRTDKRYIPDKTQYHYSFG